MPEISIFDETFISKQIAEFGYTATGLQSSYSEYKGEVDILSREPVSENAINNMLANDYRGEIIDQSVGYVFGKPISYQVNGDVYTEEALKSINKELDNFIARNNIELLDSETGEFMGACGRAARLLYIDEDGKECVMNIKPWNAIFIRDEKSNVIAGIYTYTTTNVISGDQTQRAEVYDKNTVTYYIKSSENYVIDSEKSAKQHMFDYVPLIEIRNNRRLQNDTVKVASLIDAYDRAVSCSQDEIEEHRFAYLLFLGGHIDSEEYEEMRKKGALNLPDGAKADYLIKEINDTFLENHKKTLKDNIYRFAKAVDMSDENFSGGTQSGESRKWKILALELKAIIKERNLKAGLREQFKILCSAWSKRASLPLKYEDMKFQFTRNLPVELTTSSQVLKNLDGLVSQYTALGLMPFIDDPDQEIARMEEEQAGLIETKDEDLDNDEE